MSDRCAGETEGHTDDNKLYWHKDADKVVDHLERGPLLGTQELPCSRRKN